MKKEPDPIEPILEQIGEVLKYFFDFKKRKVASELPPDFAKQVEDLRQGIALFNQIYEDALKLEGTTEEQVGAELNCQENQMARDRQALLQRAATMKMEATAIKDAFETIQKGSRTGKKAGSTKKMLRNKDLGQKKGWQKM